MYYLPTAMLEVPPAFCLDLMQQWLKNELPRMVEVVNSGETYTRSLLEEGGDSKEEKRKSFAEVFAKFIFNPFYIFKKGDGQ